MESYSNKNEWIEEVMNSTGGLQKASPKRDLFNMISERLSAQKSKKSQSFPAIRWVAAAILLLTLNVSSIIYFSKQKPIQQSSATGLASQMELQITYNY